MSHSGTWFWFSDSRDRVCVARGLTLSVEHGRQIPVVVIGIGLGIEQWIFSRARPIHVAICVNCLLVLGVGNSEEIAVRVVGKGDGTVDRIHRLRDPIKRIWRINRFLTKRVRHIAQQARNIEESLGFSWR